MFECFKNNKILDGNYFRYILYSIELNIFIRNYDSPINKVGLSLGVNF
jgi:hypothetical protein